MKLSDMNLKISVIICAYNEEQFIKNAIESYLNQSTKPYEIIVVDDGSTDDTPLILKKLSAFHPEIRIFTNDINIGKVKSHNIAYQHSAGDLIAISGGDDIARIERLEVQSKILQNFKYDVVYSNMYLFSSIDELNCNNSLPLLYPEFNNCSFTPRDLIKGASIAAGCMMISRYAADIVYPIPESLMYEDRWFFIKSLIHLNVCYSDQPLYFYRRHSGNTFMLKSDIIFNKTKIITKFVSSAKRDALYIPFISLELSKYYENLNSFKFHIYRSYFLLMNSRISGPLIYLFRFLLTILFAGLGSSLRIFAPKLFCSIYIFKSNVISLFQKKPIKEDKCSHRLQRLIFKS